MSFTTTTGVGGVVHTSSSIHRAAAPTPHSELDPKSRSNSERDSADTNHTIELRNLGQVESTPDAPAERRKSRWKAEIQFATICIPL